MSHDTTRLLVSNSIAFVIHKVIFNLDTSSKNGQQIYDLACDGLHYLDTRTDFWRQQKPMYSRKREKQDRLKGKQKKGNHEHYVLQQLERVDNGKCITYNNTVWVTPNKHTIDHNARVYTLMVTFKVFYWRV